MLSISAIAYNTLFFVMKKTSLIEKSRVISGFMNSKEKQR